MSTIISIIVIIVVAVLIYAATRPDSFRIERSIHIQATAEKIFPLLNDFHAWEAWSPWEKIDPKVQRIYKGTANGIGAIYEWKGNRNIGQGRLEIIEAEPPTKLVMKIDFITPFEAHNRVEFTLASKDGITQLTQAMYGPSPFISKLMGLFCNMEKMVGHKQEEGLTSIKSIAER